MNRVWSVLASKLQFSAALIVAGLGANVFSMDGWRRIGRAFLLWFGGLKRGSHVSGWLYRKRILACHRCPLWYAPLGTCGSPLRWKDRDLGCWCWMRAKARLKDADCWLDTERIEGTVYGWKANGL